jgi:osmotically-inducible protein OsmY
VSEVSVAVTDGTVVLEGTVPQRQMKYRIEDLSAACSGVKDVDNRIRVARMEVSPPGAIG